MMDLLNCRLLSFAVELDSLIVTQFQQKLAKGRDRAIANRNLFCHVMLYFIIMSLI